MDENEVTQNLFKLGMVVTHKSLRYLVNKSGNLDYWIQSCSLYYVCYMAVSWHYNDKLFCSRIETNMLLHIKMPLQYSSGINTHTISDRFISLCSGMFHAFALSSLKIYIDKWHYFEPETKIFVIFVMDQV